MRSRPIILLLAFVSTQLFAQGPATSPATSVRVVDAAAEAMGGKARLQAVRTMTIIGYGQMALLNGGSNIDASANAPERWVNISGSVRTIDLERGRMKLTQTQTMDFVFVREPNMRGVRSDQRLDGDIAFNIGANGRPARAGDAAVRARRLEMLNNPVALLRAALDPAARLSKLRTERDRQIVDLTTAKGDALTVAFDTATHLPAWVSWVEPNVNLGELTVRTYYSAYQPEKGLLVPFGYNSVIDFRNVVQQRFYVDRVLFDEPIDDLAAPVEVRAAAAPPQITIEVTPVAKGIWYLKGQGNSTAFEFADHITLYEAYGSEANALAIIEKARTLVPGKPVTEVILSHHHFDHTAGLRAAVAEGLKVITPRANVALFREMVSRPAKLFPDALGRAPRPMTIVPVDDKLVLKDATMEVVLYRTVNNSHMADAVIAYAPSTRTVSQADLVGPWDLVWWGNSYPETVAFHKLDVERDLPVHGDINTYEQVLEQLRRQAANAKAFCEKVAAAALSAPGCPATNVAF